MCLIAFAWRSHPRYSLVVAANRDEFHARSTAPAGFWRDAPHVLAGRDLERGGTWMGVTRSGRFAALSNYRDLERSDPSRPSRGALVANYLRGEASAEEYARAIEAEKNDYHGFNLLLGDSHALYYVSNRGHDTVAVEEGVHAVSNGLLDEPWPKVVRAREALGARLDGDRLAPDSLMDMLADTHPAPPESLPDTGVGQEKEYFLSPIFIRGESYGTRASTVLLIDAAGVEYVERRFAPNGRNPGTRREAFPLQAGALS